MITYNPAFDLYHTVYRMAHALNQLSNTDYFDVEKIRIWDFYVLFPEKIYDISLQRSEIELRNLRKRFVSREKNPYDYFGDNRKLFERLRAYQMTALSCLISYGILDRDSFLRNKIHVADFSKLDEMLKSVGNLEYKSANALSFLCYMSKEMSLYGDWGLKSRTKLLESKYDVQ